MTRFGEMLAELRNDKGLSQKRLAEIFHMSSSTISSYEVGVHLPNAEQIVQFANFFDVTTDYLLGRSPSDMSPSVLEEKFIDGLLVRDVISQLQDLPDEHRRALCVLLRDTHFGVTMRKQAEHVSMGR